MPLIITLIWLTVKVLLKIILNVSQHTIQRTVDTVKAFNFVGTKFCGLTKMDMFVDT